MNASLKEETGVRFDWDEHIDVPRDRYGRPLVVPPNGGKPVPYTRCTTFAGTLEDTYALQRWMQRMVALGLAERQDLLLSVAAHRDDKNELDQICDTAMEAAKAHAAASVGIALHKLCERLDLGQDIGEIPEAYQADLVAYYKETASLRVVAVERFVVLDDLKIGGTLDRIFELGGRRYIGDIKTGNIDYSAGKIAMQLAIYAHSVAYDPRTHAREPLNVDLNRALVVHLPAGEGRCELQWVDIAAGWEAVQLAGQVRAWRSRRDLFTPYDPHDATVELLSHELGGEVVPLAEQVANAASLAEQVANAASLAELEQLWAANKDVWTDELTKLARRRKQELHQRSLRDFVASAAARNHQTQPVLRRRINTAGSVDELVQIWVEADAAGTWTPELTELAAARKRALTSVSASSPT